MAFFNNHQEGELWESSTVFSGPYAGIIPHEPINNAVMNNKSVNQEPGQKIPLGPGTKSYIKY
jgi:hypothetical protein